MTRDAFAELYVAGLLADRGWGIYFPRRDTGIDFIATLPVGGELLVRPVQVKGKYAGTQKTDKAQYGFLGEITQMHDDLVLAMPFFTAEATTAPLFTVFLPRGMIRVQPTSERPHRVYPCRFSRGRPEVRPSFARFVDAAGLALLADPLWRKQTNDGAGA